MNWSYEAPPKKLRFLFLPTAILGFLGMYLFSGAFLGVFSTHEGRISWGYALFFLISGFVLWFSISVMTLRYRYELSEDGTLTLHRKTYFTRRKRQYPLNDFDRIEVSRVASGSNAHQMTVVPSYSKVILRGAGQNHFLHITSEADSSQALAVAQGLSQKTGLPVRET